MDESHQPDKPNIPNIFYEGNIIYMFSMENNIF